MEFLIRRKLYLGHLQAHLLTCIIFSGIRLKVVDSSNHTLQRRNTPLKPMREDISKYSNMNNELNFHLPLKH